MNEIERPPIDSELLRTFLMIAVCGNLTTASDRLGRTQSAISVQLRKLEAGLSVPLFHRTPKGMKLTSAGEALLPRARKILNQIRDASALFSNPLTGSIRVGLPDDFDDSILERVLIGFARAHPGVQVLASSGCTSGYPAAISEGTLDIAVASRPDNRLGETIGTEDTVWVAKAGSSISGGSTVPLAILDRNCWWRDLPTASLDAAGRDYTIAFWSSSFASLQAAIRAGFAVGVLPVSCVTSGLSVLAKEDGFPALPASRRSILISSSAPQDLADAMATAIRGARESDAA